MSGIFLTDQKRSWIHSISKKKLHLCRRFSLYLWTFGKKGFFQLKSITSLWNHDILKVRSKCDPMVPCLCLEKIEAHRFFFTKSANYPIRRSSFLGPCPSLQYCSFYILMIFVTRIISGLFWRVFNIKIGFSICKTGFNGLTNLDPR